MLPELTRGAMSNTWQLPTAPGLQQQQHIERPAWEVLDVLNFHC